MPGLRLLGDMEVKQGRDRESGTLLKRGSPARSVQPLGSRGCCVVSGMAMSVQSPDLSVCRCHRETSTSLVVPTDRSNWPRVQCGFCKIEEVWKYAAWGLTEPGSVTASGLLSH